MYRALGTFPLLQGINLTQEMYELDYGSLYGYSIILVLAALVALQRARAARSRLSRWVHYSFSSSCCSFRCWTASGSI